MSTNRYFDKRTGYYQGVAYAQQAARGKEYPERTRRVNQLYAKRRKQVEHILHSATRKVIEFAEREADCVGAYNIMKKYPQRTGRKPVTAVVGLDTPMMYKWNACKGFIWNQKPAFSKAM